MRTLRTLFLAVLVLALASSAFGLGQQYLKGLKVGSGSVNVVGGGFTLETSGLNDRFAIAATTGLLVAAPQLTTSGVGWTVTPTATTATGMFFDFSTTTTGDGLKLKGSTGLTGAGTILNVYDGASSVFKIADAGAITATGTINATGAVAQTQTNAAGGSANPWDYTATLGIMNGSDDFTLFDVNITNADHTSTGNTVQVMDIAAITGDAHATETAINIGSGWDSALTTASPVVVNSTLTYTTLPTATITCAAGTTALDATYYGKTTFITGDAAQTITLPANGAAAGAWMNFVVIGTDSTAPTIAAATADTLITFNDAAADSITFGSGHRIGAAVKLISTGTYWVAINVGSSTMTVTTN